MYFFIKLHSLLIYQGTVSCKPTRSGTFFWFAAWAGLDPIAFFGTANKGQGSGRVDFPIGAELWYSSFAALLKITIGFALLTLVAPRLITVSQLLAGWVGMVGIVLLLHCGIIHLMAIVWNVLGRPVKPIMNSPLLATTVSEFWGKRWNLAFRDYAHVCIFGPLVKKTNGPTAVLAGFLFSGVVHDLAISVPAGGGYGWPTLYFALQGIALLFERRLKKTGVLLSNRWTGRFWTSLWVAGPVMLLFHQPFVLNVIVPIVQWFHF